MTTAEIKALLSELKTNRSASARDCLDAIETLLAREAELCETLRPKQALYDVPEVPIHIYENYRAQQAAYETACAILNPENER